LSIFDKFAHKVCQYANLEEGLYEAVTLSIIVNELPFGGEGFVDLDLDNLPRLGQDISLQQHMQQHFFSLLDDSRSLLTMVKPVYVTEQLLRRWNSWEEWQILEGYLKSQNAIPFLVFRNVESNAKIQGENVFLADVRVMLARGQPYHYRRA
jgi:hypothetical protein